MINVCNQAKIRSVCVPSRPTEPELAASEDAASLGKRHRDDDVTEGREAKRHHKEHREHRSSKHKEAAAADAGTEKESGHRDREPKRAREVDKDRGRGEEKDRRERPREADAGRGRDSDAKPREARLERDRPRGDSRRRDPTPERRRCSPFTHQHHYLATLISFTCLLM